MMFIRKILGLDSESVKNLKHKNSLAYTGNLVGVEWYLHKIEEELQGGSSDANVFIKECVADAKLSVLEILSELKNPASSR